MYKTYFLLNLGDLPLKVVTHLKKMRYTVILVVLGLVQSVFAQKQTPQEYIELYKDLSIIEMHRSGVPASITLAQGILESNSGNSRLAKFANNHFGIKCKGNWEGNVIYANDDAPDECFRAYESVLLSYQDHSDFLRKNWRYQPLFELKTTDYQGWCQGLRKAGYATNPQSDAILISLIERYKLNQYDDASMPGTGLPKITAGETINGVPVKIAKPGETVTTIADDNYVRDRHIRKWNDLEDGEEIKAGDIVYLKPKRRSGSEEKHIVAKGEDMRYISQKYGVKLKQLYRKNRMETGAEPKAGEVIYMQKKRDSDDEVETAGKDPLWGKEEKEIFVNPHSIPKKTDPIPDTKSSDAPKKIDIKIPDYYLVEKGDNIYRIAEKYHIFEEDILDWNPDLNPNAMRIGQKIKLNNTAVKNTPPKPVQSLTDEEVKTISEKITVNGAVFHHVVKGDTLYNICKRYNVTEEQLKKWNNLDTINIQLDQKLQVSE